MAVQDSPTALIATADDAAAQVLGGVLFELGFRGVRLKSADSVRASLDESAFELIFADHSLANLNSVAILQVLRERELPIALIAVVEDNAASDGVAAVRAGAHDFLCKPLDKDEILYVVGKVQKTAAQDSVAPPRSTLFASSTQLIGTSEPIRQLTQML